MGPTLNSTDHELTAEQVRDAVRDAVPERVRHDGVRIDGRTYPIKQAFGLASGRGRDDFTAEAARNQLSALGFEIVPAGRDRPPRDRVRTSLPAGQSPGSARPVAARPDTAEASSAEPSPPASTGPMTGWHTRESLHAVLAGHLARTGWQITPATGLGARERDILATRDPHGLVTDAAVTDAAVTGVQATGVLEPGVLEPGVLETAAQATGAPEAVVAHLTGYPLPRDAGPAHPGLHQPGQPSPLAVTWFAQAVLAAMRNRTDHPAARSVIALPAAPGYEELYAAVSSSLAASGIEVWWLDKRGKVTVA